MTKPVKTYANPNDKRNVIDHYHYWSNEAIKADLDKKRHPFGVLCSNLYNDFNIATVVRNCNAFLAREVFVYGTKRFDKRGTVGTHHYEKLKHVPEGSWELIPQDYTWVAFDNVVDAEPLDTFVWPQNPLLCFGQEQVGLPPEILERCSKKVFIRQFGSVRSINVGCASAIAFYDWTHKNVG